MEKWLKSIELEDSQPSKRMKDAKTREFFEKQFPELKKARESGERFSRVGQRVARSDAEVAELLDGITEREDQDKKVKSYAVIPPMLEEMRSKKPKFINTNGYVEDIVAEYKEYQILNTWTDEEKDIFRENYLQNPKNFGLIARMTNRKNVANCVQYYYLSKKSENYKQLLKRQQKRRTRSFPRPAATTPANIEQPSDTNKTNGVNDNHAGDSATADSADQNNGSKSGNPHDFVAVKQEASDTNSGEGNTEPKATCCICNCEFNDNTQFRNVTRSNHQLYGISLDSLKPGMRICFSCRFRHVKHPNLEETTIGHDPMEVDPPQQQQPQEPQQQDNEMIAIDLTMKKVDSFPSKTGLQESNSNTDDNIESKPVITNSLHGLANVGVGIPNDIKQDILINSSKSNSTVGQPRTCVRDIIYQAIEMSFQKPADSNVKVVSSLAKPELPRSHNAPINSLPQQQATPNAISSRQIITSQPIQIAPTIQPPPTIPPATAIQPPPTLQTSANPTFAPAPTTSAIQHQPALQPSPVLQQTQALQLPIPTSGSTLQPTSVAPTQTTTSLPAAPKPLAPSQKPPTPPATAAAAPVAASAAPIKLEPQSAPPQQQPQAPKTTNLQPVPLNDSSSTREDSRSPSEMVIDESADAPSPESTSLTERA